MMHVCTSHINCMLLEWNILCSFSLLQYVRTPLQQKLIKAQLACNNFFTTTFTIWPFNSPTLPSEVTNKKKKGFSVLLTCPCVCIKAAVRNRCVQYVMFIHEGRDSSAPLGNKDRVFSSFSCQQINTRSDIMRKSWFMYSWTPHGWDCLIPPGLAYSRYVCAQVMRSRQGADEVQVRWTEHSHGSVSACTEDQLLGDKKSTRCTGLQS